MTNKQLAIFVVSAAYWGQAMAIECVSPPPTAMRDYQGQFDAAAAKVMGLKGPSATLTVKSESKNLIDKIPNADKTLVELTYLYVLCTAVRDDKAIAERQKGALIVQYTKALNSTQPNASLARPVSAKATVPATTKPQTADKAAPPQTTIQGNSAPVVNGSTVRGDLTITTNSPQ